MKTQETMRRRNKLRTCMHIVWTTKYRTPMITAAIERQVFAIVEAIFQANRCPVLAINGMPDHIHVLIVLPTTISLGDLMGRVKGGSSRIIREQIVPDGSFMWQPNYAVFAVCESHKEQVIQYIANQKRHHAEGTVWAEAEETDEEDSPPL
jgi:putative transposase